MRPIEAINRYDPVKYFFSVDVEKLGDKIRPFLLDIFNDDYLMYIYYKNFSTGEYLSNYIQYITNIGYKDSKRVYITSENDKKDASGLDLGFVLYGIINKYLSYPTNYLLITMDTSATEISEIVSRKFLLVGNNADILYPIVEYKWMVDIKDKIIINCGKIDQSGYNSTLITILKELDINVTDEYKFIVNVIRKSNDFDNLYKILKSQYFVDYDLMDHMTQYLTIIGLKVFSYIRLRRLLYDFANFIEERRKNLVGTLDTNDTDTFLHKIPLPTSVQYVYNVKDMGEFITEYPYDVIYPLRLETFRISEEVGPVITIQTFE